MGTITFALAITNASGLNTTDNSIVLKEISFAGIFICQFDHVTPIFKDLSWLPVKSSLYFCDTVLKLCDLFSTPTPLMVTSLLIPRGEVSCRAPIYVSLFVCLSVSLFVRLSVCPFVRLSVCPFVRLSVCPFVPLSLCPFVRFSVSPFFRFSVCPFVRLSV